MDLQEKSSIRYQFLMCNRYQSQNIEFKIENSNGFFKDEKYPYEQMITQQDSIIFDLNNYETLVHSFKSDKRFLLWYNTEKLNQLANNNYGSISSIYEVYKIKIIIKFNGPYFNMNRFYILIAKKDDLNNAMSFYDICYVIELISQKRNNIILKTMYQISGLMIASVDLSKLNPKENDTFVISIIDEPLFSYNKINVFPSREFKLEKNDFIEIKPGE